MIMVADILNLNYMDSDKSGHVIELLNWGKYISGSTGGKGYPKIVPSSKMVTPEKVETIDLDAAVMTENVITTWAMASDGGKLAKDVLVTEYVFTDSSDYTKARILSRKLVRAVSPDHYRMLVSEAHKGYGVLRLQ